MTTLHGLWDTTRMQLLVALERHGSLSRAAQTIGIGQSAASEHLHLLERAAGEQLAVRTGRGLRLTEAGHVLAAHAAHALASLEAGEQHLASRAGLTTGSLRLGASPVPGIYILPEALARFSVIYPGITVSLDVSSTRQVIDDLLAGRTQLAAICTHVDDDRITLQPFLEDRIVGIARPGALHLSDGMLSSKDLSGEVLLVQESGSSTRRFAENLLSASGTQWSQVWELGSIEAVKRAARVGLGIGFLSCHTVVEECGRGDLVTFQVSDASPIVGNVSLARLEGSPFAPAAQHFSRMFG
jgi:DNA-binding transcriptional LysR family regulator